MFPPCQALPATPPSPRQRPHPRAPPAGFSELTSVGELVCLFSNRWCCSAVPMATALGVLPPSRGAARNLPLPSPSPCWKQDPTGRQRGRGQGGPEDAGAAPQDPPLHVTPGGPGRGEAAPGCSTAPPRPRLWPAGPALPLGLPETTLQSRSGPGGYLPTPRLPHPSCPPGRRPCQAPTARPAATANCRPVSVPSAHPQPSLRSAADNRQHPSFLSRRSHRHPQAPARGLCSQTCPRGRRLAHTCCVPREELVSENRGRKLETRLGAKGLAGRGERAGREWNSSRGGGGGDRAQLPSSASCTARPAQGWDGSWGVAWAAPGDCGECWGLSSGGRARLGLTTDFALAWQRSEGILPPSPPRPVSGGHQPSTDPGGPSPWVSAVQSQPELRGVALGSLPCYHPSALHQPRSLCRVTPGHLCGSSPSSFCPSSSFYLLSPIHPGVPGVAAPPHMGFPQPLLPGGRGKLRP